MIPAATGAGFPRKAEGPVSLSTAPGADKAWKSFALVRRGAAPRLPRGVKGAKRIMKKLGLLPVALLSCPALLLGTSGNSVFLGRDTAIQKTK